MKKVIEVKRGDMVPTNAKWLKDIRKVTSSYMPTCDCHYMMKCTCEPVETIETFDVFEVEEL